MILAEGVAERYQILELLVSELESVFVILDLGYQQSDLSIIAVGSGENSRIFDMSLPLEHLESERAVDDLVSLPAEDAPPGCMEAMPDIGTSLGRWVVESGTGAGNLELDHISMIQAVSPDVEATAAYLAVDVRVSDTAAKNSKSQPALAVPLM